MNIFVDRGWRNEFNDSGEFSITIYEANWSFNLIRHISSNNFVIL